MKQQSYTLKNGLRVILIDTKAFPTMTTILLIGAGSRYENKQNNGIAHFFEHMVFKGSKKYPNFFTISSILEGLGAYHNAFTSKDHTGYWVKAPTSHFNTVIDILSDMTLNPILDEKEIVREKGVIIEEINMREDNPQGRVGEYFEELLYKDSSLGFDVIGSKETVSSFSKKTFIQYMNKLYHPNNAVLVVAGGLVNNQIIDYKLQIEEKFGKWRRSAQNFDQLAKPVNNSDNQNRPKVLIKYKKTEQTHFILGFKTFSFKDPKKYVLMLLATILGGGSSSRLFIEVREKRGLCYYISTGRESYKDTGYMATQAGVTNDLDKIKEAISIVLTEHKKIVKGDLKKEEISRAKEILKGRLLLSMEDSSNVASFFGTKEILENKIETVEDVIGKVEKVKMEQVQALAKEVIRKENLYFSLLGPFEEKNFKNIF